MLVFTSAINVANIQKVRAKSPLVDDDSKVMFVLAEVLGTGNVVYRGNGAGDGTYLVCARNVGLSTGIQPSGLADYQKKIEVIPVDSPGAYDIAYAAYNTGATESAKLKNLETALQSLGILNFVGSVQ